MLNSQEELDRSQALQLREMMLDHSRLDQLLELIREHYRVAEYKGIECYLVNAPIPEATIELVLWPKAGAIIELEALPDLLKAVEFLDYVLEEQRISLPLERPWTQRLLLRLRQRLRKPA